MPEFNGIDEKLKRARENINNLDAEIDRFFQSSDYPTIPQDDNELTLKAIAYHKQLVIPLRFSVLAGEIVHHLRSSLDHIVWQFSALAYREKHFRIIEFPIRKSRPVDEKSISSYEGKIKGVTDIRVRGLIHQFQPYNASDPLGDPLFILHNMDIVDKHQELVLCLGAGAMDFPIEFRDVVESYQRAHPELTPAEAAYKFKSYGKLIPQIAFKDFGGREAQPVVPGLTDLFNYVVLLVKAFAEYIN
jgi:hypothetical protein